MAGPTSNLPTISPAERAVTVLVASPHEEDHVRLGMIFRQSNWRLYSARSCSEAFRILQETSVAVIVSHVEFPDGDWRCLLEMAARCPQSPLLILASENADTSLWAEALNVGAYDLLAKPFDRGEVTRIVSLAWLHWREQQRRLRKQVVPEAPAAPARRFTATA